MNQKPQLSFWQIWNMSFGFLGIQFGFALQNANVSRIFQTLGAPIDDLAFLWLAAPVTGLLVQPIIGYMSDKTWNRLGRRRPYFLFGAIFASLALLYMPHSPTLWVAAGMLWILDASINISMEPFRAFVGDMLPDKQRTKGFAMQSFFIGIGAVVASLLPWIMTNWLGISNTAEPGIIPDSVIYSFWIGGAILLLAVLWTVIKTREYSPEELAAFEQFKAQQKQAAPVEVETRSSASYGAWGLAFVVAGALVAIAVYTFGLQKEVIVLAGLLGGVGVLQLVAGYMLRNGKTNNGVYQVAHDLFHMPRTMAQLAVVQFFSWFALFSMWIYATSAVTSYHYETLDTSSKLYNDGADWVGVLFGAYNGFAALAAIVIPLLARKLGRKGAHIVNLCLGAAGLISFIVIRDPAWLLVSMVGVGFAWASILSMPYAILSCSLPAHKMGVYMGIFNFFIVIPQIIAGSLLGLILNKLFGGEAIWVLVAGGVSFLVAAAATLIVNDEGVDA
ncbi:MFS transporter [Marinimicrobium sp. C6131]|uniref:MFS transporter n=1 Tax=Marinimicrobium sp. C6131 TaxID=3022676 RepID=UPI00223D6779|nr:MFS transporter [Marinimicrobium sp. C6131]UZJ43463.1 MFS transporter [Marinimicrobium sp. C6131]